MVIANAFAVEEKPVIALESPELGIAESLVM